MKMPFGKHKGKKIEEIVESHPNYIKWLAENCELKGELAKVIFKAYNEIDQMEEYITQCETEDEYESGFGWDDFERGFQGDD
jgi:uncharacterized protein (DUF3820 family)